MGLRPGFPDWSNAIDSDMRETLEILRFTGRSIVALGEGIDEEALWDDKILRARVEREIVALGRGLAQVRDRSPETWRRLGRPDTGVRFGDVIAAGEWIDYGSVWRAIRYDVPPLLERVEAVLGGDG